MEKGPIRTDVEKAPSQAAIIDLLRTINLREKELAYPRTNDERRAGFFEAEVKSPEGKLISIAMPNILLYDRETLFCMIGRTDELSATNEIRTTYWISISEQDGFSVSKSVNFSRDPERTKMYRLLRETNDPQDRFDIMEYVNIRAERDSRADEMSKNFGIEIPSDEELEKLANDIRLGEIF